MLAAALLDLAIAEPPPHAVADMGTISRRLFLDVEWSVSLISSDLSDCAIRPLGNWVIYLELLEAKATIESALRCV